MRVVVLFALALITVGLAADQAPPDVAAGATLFQRGCASCHNVEGRAPSLATGVFKNGGEDAQIAQTIRAGVPGTQMPPFAPLSADEIRQLVAYIRSLSAVSAIPVPGRIADRTPDPTPDPAPYPTRRCPDGGSALLQTPAEHRLSST